MSRQRRSSSGPAFGQGDTAGIIIEHTITVDLNDGQPVPPLTGFWAVVRRRDECTLCRCLSLHAEKQTQKEE
jgi:hypothetical protein